MKPGRILALFLSGPLSGLLSGLMFVAPVPIAGAQTATTLDGVVETVTAIIEIPSGGTVKYERDAKGISSWTGFLRCRSPIRPITGPLTGLWQGTVIRWTYWSIRVSRSFPARG